jgi:hypothetical protein
VKARGGRVLYFAGYRRGEDAFKRAEIEGATDQVIWCTEAGKAIAPARPSDGHYRGNIVQAMHAYAQDGLGGTSLIAFDSVERLIVVGSAGMMNAVHEAVRGPLALQFGPRVRAIGSVNSPMQCMMKGVCGQCLQRVRDPCTAEERAIFTCADQDQDFDHLKERLRMNSPQEKLTDLWLRRVIMAPDTPVRT